MQMQIGEVSERVGLSLRTIRFYEESGLVTPDARSSGGFRLYSEPAVVRLELIKRMKPLAFSVEQIGELLAVLDEVEDPGLSPEQARQAAVRLDEIRTTVAERLEALLAKAELAREFSRQLDTISARVRESS